MSRSTEGRTDVPTEPEIPDLSELGLDVNLPISINYFGWEIPINISDDKLGLLASEISLEKRIPVADVLMAISKAIDAENDTIVFGATHIPFSACPAPGYSSKGPFLIDDGESADEHEERLFSTPWDPKTSYGHAA